MAYKQSKHLFQGMSKDLSDDKQKGIYYIDAHNIRITAREDTTLLSVTNEKGNTKLIFTAEDGINYPGGQYIGHAVLNDYLILFNKQRKGGVGDAIWRMNMKRLTSKRLYLGNLNFSEKAPIETLADYETDRIQKVYWTDGKNQPRVINIIDGYTYSGSGVDAQFDFAQNLKLNENVTITKNIGEGLYTAGTIQYAFTYISKLGIETKPFYVSPLYYIAFQDRGAAPDTTVANNFTIDISNLDLTYKYINIYSIQRTSTDSDATGKLVVSLDLEELDTNSLSYTDKGIIGSTVEASSLFYLGSEKVVAYTMSAKDNTLFLGNLTLKSIPYDEELKNLCKQQRVHWTAYNENLIPLGDSTDLYYKYENQLGKNSNQIKTFKYRETYRLGIQFQEENGKWSEPYFIGDFYNGNCITYEDTNAVLTKAVASLNASIVDRAMALGYKKVRPLMVQSELSDRNILCQGIVCPTVFNVEDRSKNAPFAQSSWFIRPEIASDNIGVYYYILNDNNMNGKYGYVQNISSLDSLMECIVNGHTYDFMLRYKNRQGTNPNYLYPTNDHVGDSDWNKGYMVLYLYIKDGYLVDSTAYDTSITTSSFTEIQFTEVSNWVYDENTHTISGTRSNRGYFKLAGTRQSTDTLEIIPNLMEGVLNESRHNYPLPDNLQTNSEIQCNGPLSKYNNNLFTNCYTRRKFGTAYDENDNRDANSGWIKNNSSQFFVDKSIVTFHSPELELSTSLFTLDVTPYKLRIVGMIPITGCISDMSLETEGGPSNFRELWASSSGSTTVGHCTDTNIAASGFYKTTIGIKNPLITSYTNIGGLGRGNFPSWIDAIFGKPHSSQVSYYDQFSYGASYDKAAFVVYPWHRSGPLNNTGNKTDLSTAVLSQKKMSNLHYSNKTLYFTNKVMNLDSGVPVVFDGGISSPMITLASPEGTGLPRITYYGEYDNLIAPAGAFNIVMSGVGRGASTSNHSTYTQSNVKDRDIVTSWRADNPSTLYGDEKSIIYGWNTSDVGDEGVRISYKSSPHFVIALNCDDEGKQIILPSFASYGKIANPFYKEFEYSGYIYGEYPFWLEVNDPNPEPYTFHQDSIVPNDPMSVNPNNGYTLNTDLKSLSFLYLGELYNPNVVNRFGGNSDAAIKSNKWIPAGEATDLTDTGTTVNWTEGDTYFQRYDCLKTFQYSNESKNNIVEIMSFMCETRINIDGRYDRNRGLENNLNMTNENFNLINEGYTQDNNFFNYRVLGERYANNIFKNQLTWTKTKSPGAIVDNWTNVSVAGVLDLDGDKGEIVSLNRYKNDIIAFQPKGISQIIYNPNVQINTTSGLPIEIANSGKVQGKRYLYEGVGCQNKWSICDEVYGSLYFMDNLNKSIYKLNDQGLVSLTDTKGFRAWMEEVSTTNMWSPYVRSLRTNVTREAPKGFRTFYDKTYKDVYFVNNKTCLVYSDLLDQFVSFMDYQKTDGMVNVGDNFYAFYGGKVWKQFDGVYDNIYEIPRFCDITFIDNQIPEMNKIFTNLEFRSDLYDYSNSLIHNRTFDTIRVYNEYQDSGEVGLLTTLDMPYLSNIQKKFRVWRIQLPRDKHNPLNRINNTWTKITLKHYNSRDKLVLHDAVVGYYI